MFEFKEYTNYEPFRFYAYMTPPPANAGVGELSANPDCMTDKHYKAVAECGFNRSIGIYDKGLDLSKKALAGLQPYGVKHIPADEDFLRLAKDLRDGKDVTALLNTLKKHLTEYKKFDNFGGVSVVDEPVAGILPYLGQAKALLEKDFGNYQFWYNLLPEAAGAAHIGMEDYSEYVKLAAKNCGGRLSFDSYALTKDGIRQDHFKNSAIVASVAKECGMPWDAFILTMGHWDYITPKNYADLAWQIYSYMAFGAQGIETFTYWTTMTTGEKVTHGLCDYYGNKTQTWYSMREVIKEVRAFEAMYMNSAWEGTMVYAAKGNQPNVLLTSIPDPLKKHARIASLKAEKDFLLGAFKDKDGRDAFLLVNVTNPADNAQGSVTLKFNNATKAVIYKKGRKVIESLENGVLKIIMGCGEGNYIIPLVQ